MKIIWITSLFPSGSNTTKGIYLYRNVRALSEYFDIRTLCIFPALPPYLKMFANPFDAKKNYDDWKKNFPKNHIAPEGLNLESVNYFNYWRLPRRLFNHWEGYFSYLKIRKYIKKTISEDTIFHAHWIFPSGQLARIISMKYNVPYMVSLLGTDVHRLKYGTRYWLAAKKVLNDAKIICSVSKQLIEKCEKEKIDIPAEKVRYIDNIYDEDTFRIKDKKTTREILSIDQNKKVILFAGGLIEVKNIDTLVKAFSEILIENKKCLLIIAGSGEKERYLKNMVNRLGINNEVRFLGNLSQPTLIDCMNAADVFCLPSNNEGTPNVIIESLLCGIPVVASNVGGIPEIINPGVNGFLFEPSSVKDLHDKLLESLKIIWNRNLLRQSVKRFFRSEVTKKYLAIYSEMEN